MTESSDSNRLPRLTEGEELRWHQLDLLRRLLPRPAEEQPRQDVSSSETDEPRSETWGLASEIEPYPWQESALEAWEGAGRKGIVKVVTGAGKTVLALMCLSRLLEEDQAVRASIVVPTRVLLDQWYEELVGTLGLPEGWVGRRSGEFHDDFSGHVRVMIYVINSARSTLGEPLSSERLRADHFLIVDECHRAGSEDNSSIFKVPRRYTLGLSATPERPEDELEAPGAEGEAVPSVIGEALGPIIYELTFEEALKEGIIPPFELVHCAIDLTARERKTYDKLSRELTDVRKKLQASPQFQGGASGSTRHFGLIKSLARKDRSEVGKLAARYEALVSQRKELLYRAENRGHCFEDILRREREQEVRIMAFHERIEEVDRLFTALVRSEVPVVLDHTGLTQTQRERSLALYLRGAAPVLLSVKALIEGVNAPATDVGVIIAASSSPRQKVQSLGRVMRRYPGKETSRIYNLYVKGTVDEEIFRRLNFESLVGVGSVEYRHWRDEGTWEELEGPPYVPLPADSEVPPDKLVVGESYPGEDAGMDLSMDTQGNVFRRDQAGNREFLDLPKEILGSVREVRDGGGRIRITPRCGHVLVPAPNLEGGWDVFYAGSVDVPLNWTAAEDDRVVLGVSARHGGSLVLGKGRGALLDRGSPATKDILELVRGFAEQGQNKVHKVEIDPDRRLFTRLSGQEVLLGTIDDASGWPFGKGTFEELKKEATDGS